MGSTTSKPAPPLAQPNEKCDVAAARGPRELPLASARRNHAKEETGPSISIEQIRSYRANFESDKIKTLSSVLLSNQDWSSALIAKRAIEADLHVFNHKISHEGAPRTDQQSTGRCWLYAITNILRREVMKTLHLPAFELSQSYLALYDKLEKANYFLEQMIDLAEEDIDSRLVKVILSDVGNDGGQFHFIQALVRKYGVIPKVAAPETFNTSHTARMNRLLVTKLREDALELRAICRQTVAALDQSGVTDCIARKQAVLQACRARKQEALDEVYSILAIAAGGALHRPDEAFTWDYINKSGRAHTITSTPLEFFKKYCSSYNPDDCVSLTNDPRNKYSSLLTVDRLRNMAGPDSSDAAYINTSSDRLIDVVKTLIDADHPVWFGCDVGQKSSSPLGILDTALYDDETPFGISLGLNKAERMQTGVSSMTHAMCIVAYHEHDGKVLRFRVENSYGSTPGDKGWYLCTVDWFREYVYQIVAPKAYVPKDLLDVLHNGNAKILPRWDPMCVNPSPSMILNGAESVRGTLA